MDAFKPDTMGQTSAKPPPKCQDIDRNPSAQHASTPIDAWLYPRELDLELQGVDLPFDTIAQTRTAAWEYARCIIPSYTNWSRYLAFCRVVMIGVITEVHGSLVDVAVTDRVLGYDLSDICDELFAGAGGAARRDAMARELRTFLLATAEKSGRAGGSELFRRYVDALAEGPRTWFRLRDADALARFSFAAALACNDADDLWFSEGQLQVLAEVGCTLYDAVAFYKHRAEGETHNTFAYVDPRLRVEAFRRAREVLWALDVAWARQPERLPVLNLLRLFGGPTHLTMRRYRFVEDGLRIGNPETEELVAQTWRNVKLWNHVGPKGVGVGVGNNDASYRAAVAQEGRVLFEGLAALLQLQETDRERCNECRYQASYGSERTGQFGGVQLCDGCRKGWDDYIHSLPQRAVEAFPELRSTQLLVSLAHRDALE